MECAFLDSFPGKSHNKPVIIGVEPENVQQWHAGITAEGLDAAIEKQGAVGKAPRVLYVVPHGQNPTGCSLSMKRKEAIYAVCSKHDVAIVEDDAYCFLQYPATPPRNDGNEAEDECPGALPLARWCAQYVFTVNGMSVPSPIVSHSSNGATFQIAHPKIGIHWWLVIYDWRYHLSLPCSCSRPHRKTTAYKRSAAWPCLCSSMCRAGKVLFSSSIL
jgi:hypothetical protein